MPLDQLLAALEREALRSAEHLLAEARTEAEGLLEQSEHEVARRRDAATAMSAREHRAAIESAIADAARAARRDTLNARDHLLARVFAAVRVGLPEAITQAAYRDTLPTRVAAAAACVDARETLVLRCPAALLASLQTIAIDHPGITVQQRDDIGSGFRLATTDGAIEVDATLESRLTSKETVFARKALLLLEQAA